MQYEEYNLGWWAVVPDGQPDLIGWNGLQYLPETGEVEVVYLLSKRFWGRGYATKVPEPRCSLGSKHSVLSRSSVSPILRIKLHRMYC